MKYIIGSFISIRSWWKVPYTYYKKEKENVVPLSEEEYCLLCKCDGKTDLEDSPLLQKLMKMQLIRPALEGETTGEYSRPKFYNNRMVAGINLQLTGKCNYNCLHCFNAADNSPLQSEFTLEEALHLIEEAKKCGVISFTLTGGEPMAHKHFMEIVRAIYEHDMIVKELTTNGFYLTQKVLDEFKEIGCAPLIKISFDGLGFHDWMRNRVGAQEDALRAIKLCIDNGFRVKAQYNFNRKNVSTVTETLKMLNDMGVAETRLIRTTEVPRWAKNAPNGTFGDLEFYDVALNVVRDYVAFEPKMALTVWQTMTILPESHSYNFVTVKSNPQTYNGNTPLCKDARNLLAIGANGNVYPCLQMSGLYDLRGEVLDNAKRDGLQKILQHSRFLEETCQTVHQRLMYNEDCQKCPYWKYCNGGCPALGTLYTGSMLGRDHVKCDFFKNRYYEKFEEILTGWKNTTPIHIEEEK